MSQHPNSRNDPLPVDGLSAVQRGAVRISPANPAIINTTNPISAARMGSPEV